MRNPPEPTRESVAGLREVAGSIGGMDVPEPVTEPELDEPRRQALRRIQRTLYATYPMMSTFMLKELASDKTPEELRAMAENPRECQAAARRLLDGRPDLTTFYQDARMLPPPGTTGGGRHLGRIMGRLTTSWTPPKPFWAARCTEVRTRREARCHRSSATGF